MYGFTCRAALVAGLADGAFFAGGRALADAASNGNTFGPYTSVLVSDAEEALGGVQSTFDSIQPPDAGADALRTELDGLLSDALTHVSNVRVARSMASAVRTTCP